MIDWPFNDWLILNCSSIDFLWSSFIFADVDNCRGEPTLQSFFLPCTRGHVGSVEKFASHIYVKGSFLTSKSFCCGSNESRWFKTTSRNQCCADWFLYLHFFKNNGFTNFKKFITFFVQAACCCGECSSFFWWAFNALQVRKISKTVFYNSASFGQSLINYSVIDKKASCVRSHQIFLKAKGRWLPHCTDTLRKAHYHESHCNTPGTASFLLISNYSGFLGAWLDFYPSFVFWPPVAVIQQVNGFLCKREYFDLTDDDEVIKILPFVGVQPVSGWHGSRPEKNKLFLTMHVSKRLEFKWNAGSTSDFLPTFSKWEVHVSLESIRIPKYLTESTWEIPYNLHFTAVALYFSTLPP